MQKVIWSICGIFIITVALVMPACAQSYLTNGLLAYYPFSGNANDASGNGYNITTNSEAVLTTDRFGNANSAYYFNNAYMQCTNLPLNLAGPYTFSMWMNLRGYTNQNVPGELSIGTECAGNPQIYENNSSLYYSQCNGPSGGPPFATAATLVGSWHQLVAVVATNGTTTIYTDGKAVAISSISWPSSTKILLTLGAAGNWLPQACNASLDDIRLYNRALASNEVAQLYAYETGPTITQDLTNEWVLIGHNATFSVSATGQVPLSYSWYFVGTNPPNIAGGYAQISGQFVYNVVLTNGGSTYGNMPSVTFVGGGGSGAAGYATVSNGVVTTVTMTNAGTGYTSAPAVAIGAPNGWIFGQTNSSLTITNVGITNYGNYHAVISAGLEYATSSVVSLNEAFFPTITTNPMGFTQPLYGSGTLSAAATGTAPLVWQWMLNATNLPGATNNYYAINNLNLATAGSYSVEVTNLYGLTFSTPVYVEIVPTLTSPFTGAAGLWGQSTLLSVGAVGSGTLGYQWYFDGAAISGATNSSYDFGSIQFTNAGLYSVVVSSPYGSVTNSPYQVVVNPADISLGIFPGVIISGTVGYVYAIQGSTDLSNTNNWVTLTNLTLTMPLEIWSDYGANAAQPGNPHKFYQVIPAQ